MAVFIAATPAKETVMAKRKKRVAARKGKATRVKAGKSARSLRRKPAKPRKTKAKLKKRATKTKKRAVAKSMVPNAETVVVDIVEEPVPGVLVVTELKATDIRGSNVGQEQPDEGPGWAPPKSKER